MRRRAFIAALGAATAWSQVANAQQRPPRIGYLRISGLFPDLWSSFQQGLSDAGFMEGTNLAVEHRSADDRYDRLPALALDLVNSKVDLIVAPTYSPALAAKNATGSIPIVFTSGVDPVEGGLVASLARPGGNLTGISFLTAELVPKRIELLCELIPKPRAVALLVNPRNSNTERSVAIGQEAAQARGSNLQILRASTESEIEAALMDLHADGLVIGADTFLYRQSGQLAELALRRHTPATGEGTDFTHAGGLLSYGTDFIHVFRQLGIYAGRILKGEKPADLPVQQPTKYELVVNLKTAKALGLTVPPTLLARADEVIE